MRLDQFRVLLDIYPLPRTSSCTRQRCKQKEWLTGTSPLVAECMDFIDEGLNGLAFGCIISFSDSNHVAMFAGLTCLTQLTFGTTENSTITLP